MATTTTATAARRAPASGRRWDRGNTISMIRPIRRRTLQPHCGAFGHLVHPSRGGAPTRPTIAAVISGRVGHYQFGVPTLVLALRRNATFGNYLGRRSRIAKRPSVHLMTVRAPRIPVAITSRVTTDHSASRPDPRYGRAHRSNHSRSIGRLPVSGGDRRVRPVLLRLSDRARPPHQRKHDRVGRCAGRRGPPGRRGPRQRAPDRG